MKLEGSLDAFSLPDIFQLLSFTKKTGGLHLQRDQVRGCVYFADGAATGAVADDRRQALARRAVGSGAVDDEALAAAVERAANGDTGVCRALLEGGGDPDLLRDLASEQLVDAVFDLLRWEDGDFSFAVGQTNPDDVGIALAVDEVVADARARLASWEAACQLVPSPDAVPALPIAVGSDPTLTCAEWALLALVDRGLLVMGAAADGDAAGGADALARRLAVLARLETDTSTAPASAPSAPARSPEPSAPAAAAEPAAVTEPSAPEALPVPEPEATPEPARFEPAPARAEHQARPEPVARPEPGGRPVTPARPEPFQPARRPEFPEPAVSASRAAFTPSPAVPVTNGSAAMAADPKTLIERDPSVNKSLLLRLIAGVRGL